LKAIISSTKGISQSNIFTVAAGAITSIQPIVAVQPSEINLTTEIEEGSLVKAIYCEYWFASDDAAVSSVIVNVEKINTTQTSMTAAEASALGSYANKKNIFIISQGLLSTNVGTPTPLLRQWIKIPKGKQRFGLGDKIHINIKALSNGVNICGFSLWKSYK